MVHFWKIRKNKQLNVKNGAIFREIKVECFTSDNDLVIIFQIREMEDRRKVVACLELCGKSDNDITKMLDGADKRGDLGMDAFVPQRIQDYIDKAKVCIQYRDRIQYCF